MRVKPVIGQFEDEVPDRDESVRGSLEVREAGRDRRESMGDVGEMESGLSRSEVGRGVNDG